MTTLGQRLRQARKNKKLSQRALAELVGIKQQAVQRIERGDVKHTCFMVELAQALEVSPDWLATGKEWQPPIIYSSEFQSRYTPTLVSQAPLLAWNEINLMRNLPLDTQYHTGIPIYNFRGDKCFVLQLQDNSMQSHQAGDLTFLKNDLIFVQTGRVPLPDEFVIAKLSNEDKIVFRRYISEAHENFVLVPLNTTYPPIAMTPAIEIIGVVFMRYSQLN